MLTINKKSQGVLGMNARNLAYIRPSNLKGAIRLANNKLRSKEVLFKSGIPVPKIYGIIKNRKDLEIFKWADLPKSFVLKPNHGKGGEGIKIIYGQKKDQSWVSTEGKPITIRDLQNHIMDIFEGFYSLSGIPDIAFFEERIKISKNLKPYAYKGIPDIRVIVYNKVPVMAMLRLPTKESGGKANLHLGGIGLGIDIATGVTTHAVMYDERIEKTPDTKLKLSGIKIPYWKEILEIAIKCQEVSRVGYIGVDVAIDKDRGPVVLEINAHPGLSIQIANLAPLKYRLQKVSGLKVKNEAHGIRIAQDLFGGEVEQEIQDISGKQILGIIETIRIKYNEARILNLESRITNHESRIANNKAKLEIAKGSTRSMEPTNGAKEKIVAREMELKAKIDTGADLSSIDKNLAKELGYGEVIEEFDEAVKNIKIDNNSTKESLDLQIKDKLAKWGENYETAVIKSSHGVSYRLLIKMNIILSGVEIISKMSITDRSNLEFPVIIGRKSLGRFLVDPSKAQSYLPPKINIDFYDDKKRKDVDQIIVKIIEAEKKAAKEDRQAKEKIIIYTKEINEILGINDIYYYISPYGLKGKSYALEMKIFIEKMDDDKYNPKFEYLNLDKIKSSQFEIAFNKLESVFKKVKFEDNDAVKEIIMEVAVLARNKINFLMSVQKKDEEKAFEYAKNIYGDINEELVRKAEDVYERLLSSNDKKEDAEAEELRARIFSSSDIKNKFEDTLNMMGLSNWDVVLDNEAGQITVKLGSEKYTKPTVVIPANRKINGLNLLKTIIHEVVHIKTNSNNDKIGFGGAVFSRDYDLYQEGLARITSNNVLNEIYAVEKELPCPYYILVMEKIRNGYNYHQSFDYIYRLKVEEFKRNRRNKHFNIEKAALKETMLILRRVFRGFRKSLSFGRAYFPKDKMYLEGEILAQKMCDNGMENYLIASKIDPYILLLFMQLGIIRKEHIKYNLEKDLVIYKELSSNL